MNSLTQIESKGNSNESPFNTIKRSDVNGNEYWLARELMSLLGYTKWQRFGAKESDQVSVIEKAIISCKTSGTNPDNHFEFLPNQVKRTGRPSEDWKLSRYACYLVAMNGDVTKSEIATAQAYFVIKTREAEVVIPEKSDRIQELEIQLEISRNNLAYAKEQTYKLDRAEAVLTLHGAPMFALLSGYPNAVVEVKEKITETIVIKDGRQVDFEGQSTAEVARKLGFKTGKELERWLTSIGHENVICQGLRAVQAPYIPTENLGVVNTLFTEYRTKSGRQTLIGE